MGTAPVAPESAAALHAVPKSAAGSAEEADVGQSALQHGQELDDDFAGIAVSCSIFLLASSSAMRMRGGVGRRLQWL